MVDTPDNIMINHLRALREDTAKIRQTQTDHTKQLSALERQLAHVRRDVAEIHELIVDHSDKFRTLENRIERLEQQAGLSDAFKQ